MGVEQQHASLTLMHRRHPELGPLVLAIRSFFHQCRHLVNETSGMVRQKFYERKIGKEERRSRQKLNGKQMYLKQLMAQLKENRDLNEPCGSGFQQGVIKGHGALYDKLRSQ